MDTKDALLMKRGRRLYIVQATLEYLISLLVSGAYLASLTRELGFSDSLTGILSSVISLGCLFQLLSVFLGRTRVKHIVIILSVVNQLLFMLLYIIPLTGVPKIAKDVLFVVFIFAAYIIYNFVHPKKINWMMTQVDDHHRGIFTANKEIVSLITGMIYSYLMGSVIDHFKNKGEVRTAFIIAALVIFTLMTLHTISLVFITEKRVAKPQGRNLRESIKDVFRNQDLLRVMVVFAVYYISKDASVPFYGTYKIHELGFSLTFVSVLAMCGSVSRILVSKAWGRYADRRSFSAMIEKCLMVMAVAQLCAMLAVPGNAKIMFFLYGVLHGISMGGINSAFINMVFDYVSFEKRADSLAITQAAAGVIGFLTTLCISPLVSYIQSNGNTFLGINVYAQQVVTAISLALTVFAIIYVKTAFKNRKNNAGDGA